MREIGPRRLRVREGARRRKIRKPGDLPDETLLGRGPRETRLRIPGARDSSRTRPRQPSCRTGGSNGDPGNRSARLARRFLPADSSSTQLRCPGSSRALFRRASAAPLGVDRARRSPRALGRGPRLRHRAGGRLGHAAHDLRDLRRDRARRAPTARARASGPARRVLRRRLAPLLRHVQLRGVDRRPEVPEDTGRTLTLLCRGHPVLLGDARGRPPRDGGALRAGCAVPPPAGPRVGGRPRSRRFRDAGFP